jgi:hypothetical protein
MEIDGKIILKWHLGMCVKVLTVFNWLSVQAIPVFSAHKNGISRPSSTINFVILYFQISKILYSDSSSESLDENRDPEEEVFKKPR